MPGSLSCTSASASGRLKPPVPRLRDSRKGTTMTCAGERRAGEAGCLHNAWVRPADCLLPGLRPSPLCLLARPTWMGRFLWIALAQPYPTTTHLVCPVGHTVPHRRLEGGRACHGHVLAAVCQPARTQTQKGDGALSEMCGSKQQRR